jgi:hypothetical protein
MEVDHSLIYIDSRAAQPRRSMSVRSDQMTPLTHLVYRQVCVPGRSNGSNAWASGDEMTL